MPEGRRLRTVDEEQVEAGRAAPLDASGRLLGGRSGRTTAEQWWSASLDSVKTADTPTIPLPPQITEEKLRFEAARAAAEKAEALRKAMAQRDEERRRAMQKAVNVSVTCDRCGALCNDTPEEVFSFCPECGADLPNRARSTMAAAANPSVQAQQQQQRTPGRQTVSASASATVGGFRQTGTVASSMATTPSRSMVSPGIAAFCSFLLPGTGQLLNGQPEKGILLLLGMYIAAFLFAWPPMSLPLLAVRIVVALDAYRIAERRRRGRPVRSGEWDIS